MNKYLFFAEDVCFPCQYYKKLFKFKERTIFKVIN